MDQNGDASGAVSLSVSCDYLAFGGGLSGKAQIDSVLVKLNHLFFKVFVCIADGNVVYNWANFKLPWLGTKSSTVALAVKTQSFSGKFCSPR